MLPRTRFCVDLEFGGDFKFSNSKRNLMVKGSNGRDHLQLIRADHNVASVGEPLNK